jgi:hypothetical protein
MRRNMERIPTDASSATTLFTRSAIPEALTQLPRQWWRVILCTVMEMGFSNTIKTLLVLHRLTSILASKKRKLDPRSGLALTSPHSKNVSFYGDCFRQRQRFKQLQLIVALRAGREFDWRDVRVAKDQCGRLGSWARYGPITIRARGSTCPLLTRVGLKHHGRGAKRDLGLCSYSTQWRPF